MLNAETLEERLRRDLDRVQPGAVPLDALVGGGRTLRARRRAGFAAGLAAVVALAVGVPFAVGAGGWSDVSPGGHTKVLASGTIGGARWSFVAGERAPDGCTGYVDARWKTDSAGTCLGELPAATDPAFLTSSGGQGTVSLFIAQLRPDVDHVTVTGTDGVVFTPTVAWFSGRRYAFFALAPKQGISRLDAYAAGGKAIAYTVPYNGPDNAISLIESWYPAGTTPTQAAVRQTLLSDPASATATATATVDLGPFGVCYLLSAPQGIGGVSDYGPFCHSVTPPTAGTLTIDSYPFIDSYQFGERQLLVGEVNTAVKRVEITMSDGSTVQLTPIPIGGHQFVATFLTANSAIRGAKSFNASGAQLAKFP